MARRSVVTGLVAGAVAGAGAVGARLLLRRRARHQRETSAHSELGEIAAREGAGASGDGAATTGTGDDLKVIEGIGPRMEQALKSAGVTTYAQLARLRPRRIETILRETGTRMARPDTWPQQARLAARGQWDRLRDLQKELKAGRRKS